MNICWKQLKDLFRRLPSSFISPEVAESYKKQVWALFCVFFQRESPSSVAASFEWLICLFICFFGKFVNTLTLKEYVESVFPFQLDKQSFQAKVNLIKIYLQNSSKAASPEGVPLDITSAKTYGRDKKTGSARPTLLFSADSTSTSSAFPQSLLRPTPSN